MKTTKLITRMNQAENSGTKQQALTEDELEQAAGGLTTWMRCSNCGEGTVWAGDFVGCCFKCPVCRRETFVGERYDFT